MAIKMYIKSPFFIYDSELLDLLILYDLGGGGAETNISDVYCSSSDLCFIVNSMMTYLLLK